MSPIPHPLHDRSPRQLLTFVLSFYHDGPNTDNTLHNNPYHNQTTAPGLQSQPLTKRYDAISIPASYGRLDDSPSPGTVTGILLGSVGGFVLILYLLYMVLGPRRMRSSQTEMSESIDVGPMRRPASSRRRVFVEEEEMIGGGRRGRWVRKGGRPRDDRVVVEESVTSASHTEDSNVVEVIEEQSSVSGGGGGRRSRSGRGGWRRGDPYEISEYGSSR